MTELLTLDNVAERLQVSRRQVDRYVQKGAIKVVRLGYRTLRVTETEFAKFIRERERRGRAA